MFESNKPLELSDVVFVNGSKIEINYVKLRILIEEKTGIPRSAEFLTDMIVALDIERETWVSDDNGSYDSLYEDTFNKALQVILLQDAIDHTSKIKHFKQATARSSGTSGFTAGPSSLDLYYVPYIDWGNGVGCYPDPVCGCGSVCDGGGDCCECVKGDGIFIAAAVSIACCSCISAVCAGIGLRHSTTDSEPTSVTFVKWSVSVSAAIVSFWLMAQYAHSTMHDRLCAYLINRNNSTGSCEENPSESSESTIIVNLTIFSVAALTFALMACLFSKWRTVERTNEEVAKDMQLHVDQLMQDTEVKSLFNKLSKESSFVAYLTSAKDKGKQEYEAVKIILAAIRLTLGGSTNELAINIQPSEPPLRSPGSLLGEPGAPFNPAEVTLLSVGRKKGRAAYNTKPSELSDDSCKYERL